MRGIGLVVLLGALAGCETAPNACTSACNDLLGCFGSPACKSVPNCPPTTPPGDTVFFLANGVHRGEPERFGV